MSRRGAPPWDSALPEPDQQFQQFTGSLPDRWRRGTRNSGGPTRKEVAKTFIKEYGATIQGGCNEVYACQKTDPVRMHVNPLLGDRAFGDMATSDMGESRVLHQTSRVDPAGPRASVSAMVAPPRSLRDQVLPCVG